MSICTIAYIQKQCAYKLLQTRSHVSHCKKFVLRDHISKHNNTIWSQSTILEQKHWLPCVYTSNLITSFNHEDYMIFNISYRLKMKHLEDKHLQIYHYITSKNTTTSHLHIIHHIHYKNSSVFNKKIKMKYDCVVNTQCPLHKTLCTSTKKILYGYKKNWQHYNMTTSCKFNNPSLPINAMIS
jgi:hypothetical protein